MMIATGILSQVKICLDQIEKWNPTRFGYPYVLKELYFRDPDSIEEDVNQISYELEARPDYIKRDWMVHAVILSVTSVTLLYECIFEDSNMILQRCLRGFFFTFTAGFAAFTYLQRIHAVIFAKFFNELLRFEERSLEANNNEVERKHWEGVEYRKMVNYGMYLFRVTFKFDVLAWTLLVTMFPFSSLRIVPAFVLNIFAKINCFSELGNFVITEICTRVISCVYSLILVIVISSYMIIILPILFLASQYTLCLATILLKRYMY